MWGAFHGFFLIMDRLFLIEFNKKIGKIPSILLTFGITLIGWVIFASNDISQIESYLYSMVGLGSNNALVVIDIQTWTILLIAILFSFAPLIKKLDVKLNSIRDIQILSQNQALIISFTTFLLLTVSLCYIAASGFNPFIYFRF